MTPPQDGPDGLTGLRLTLASLTIYVGMICSNLDMVILQNALPSLTRDLGIGSSQAVWIVTLYMLVLLILLLPLSSLSDRIGYKRTYLWGFSVFALASLGCGLSSGFATLQIGRAFQGLGAAAMMCSTTSLIRLVYPRRMMARAIANNATAVALSIAIGPSLAAFILSHAHWQWLFWINVPLGAATIALGAWALPPNPVQLALAGDRATLAEWRGAVARIDWRSFLLNAVFFVLLLLGSDQIADQPLAGSAMLAVGAVTAWAFIRRELKVAHPMLPLDLLADREYALTILTSFCSFATQGAAFVALPFLLQHSLGYGLAESGMVMTAWPVALAVIAPVAARIGQRYPIPYVCGIGLAVLCAGLALMATQWLPARPLYSMLPLALCGAGFGLFQAPNNYLIIAAAPAGRSGAVGGLRAVTRVFGQLVGAAAVGLMFAFTAGSAWDGALIGLYAAAALAAFAAYFSLVRQVPRERLERR